MRRIHGKALPRFGSDPAIQGATAGKHQRMQRVAFNHSNLEITIERRGRDIFPH